MGENLYNIKLRTALPIDTKDVLGEEGSSDNFALLFNKLAHFSVKEDIEQNYGDINRLLKGEIKAHFFLQKSKKEGGERKDYHLDLTKEWNLTKEFEQHYQQFLDSHTAAAKALFSTHDTLELKANWRLAIGMGNESVYENGFTFHPTYGIPYLPGSSLKGMTRHWAMGEGKDKEEKDKNGKNDYLKIFGNEQHENKNFHQGQIIFFDAFPTKLEKDCLQPDIMNNHYPDYYEGNKPPADWLSPRPIFFLTMKEVKFRFHLGCKKPDAGDLLKIAQKWLECALYESGVGAKTAVGYGRIGQGKSKCNGENKQGKG